MRKLIRVNTRGQVSLGSLAQYEMYEATIDQKGSILLVPVVVTPVAQKNEGGQR